MNRAKPYPRLRLCRAIRMRKSDRTTTAMGVREDIVMASMDTVLGCMNVLTTDYNNKNNKAH